MQCKKCNENFSRQLLLDGKRYNLQRRKYCLKCSPFKQHNTRKIHEVSGQKCFKCTNCQKDMCRKKERGKLCWNCRNKLTRQTRVEMVKKLVGDSCWLCGYNKCWSGLDLHHVYSEDKLFNLSVRYVTTKWLNIVNELKKCVLLCACCHREVHAGLISSDVIEKLHQEKWVE